ncbi:hypothetical protein QBC39DRAFT_374948 [Podospora conica]|nr:hypothetical protein QBC39DRAFT_374948 [Schizothecium conicum]
MVSQAITFLLWWGLRLSLVVGCLAVVLRSFQPQQHPLSQDLTPKTNTTKTICYQGIRPSSRSPTIPDACLVVDPATGLFTSDVVPRSEVDGADGVELRDGYVLPGLWDGHGHLLQYGEFLHSVDLFGATSPAEVRERVARYLEGKPPGVGGKGEWIRGVGWDQMVMGGMPSAAMLDDDPRLRGKFMMLDRVDVHCTWVSPAVLSLLPSPLPPSVPGGEIVRHPGPGVFCDNAMDLVVPLWPKPTASQKRQFLASATKALHAVGLVGIHDAGVQPSDLTQVYATTPLTLRIYAMLECPTRNTFCPSLLRHLPPPTPYLTIRAVKLFADGALGSWGSALLSPYSDRPSTSGSLLLNATFLTHLTKSWSAPPVNFQVAIHAIGDRANRLALDAIAAALADLCPDRPARECQETHRFRIEHAQIIHPSDQARMRNLGVVPSIQPTHATSDSAYAERRLGRERTRTSAYRMRSLLDLDPVFGSDFPVEPPSPWAGVYAATTRRDPKSPPVAPPGDGGEGEGWYVEEAVGVEDALAGFLEGAARGGFMEGRAGGIRGGMWGDWIVLGGAVEGVEGEGWRGVKVEETWVGGRRVFKRGEGEGEGVVGEL